MEPFAADVSEMNALRDALVAEGGHPPVTELCDNVIQRYGWVTASVEARSDSTDRCSKIVTEFDDGESGNPCVHANDHTSFTCFVSYFVRTYALYVCVPVNALCHTK